MQQELLQKSLEEVVEQITQEYEQKVDSTSGDLTKECIQAVQQCENRLDQVLSEMKADAQQRLTNMNLTG